MHWLSEALSAQSSNPIHAAGQNVRAKNLARPNPGADSQPLAFENSRSGGVEGEPNRTILIGRCTAA